MKIEVGKKYLTREGEIVTIQSIRDCGDWPVKGYFEGKEKRQAWTLEGYFFGPGEIEDRRDLVSKYVEPRENPQWTAEQMAAIAANEVLSDAPLAKNSRDGGGMRHNKGKTRFGLLPAAWTRALAEVMTKGAEKYAPRNWERGMDPAIMIDCMMRHVDAYRRGERYDAETGCHHLAHAAWNILALMTYDIRGMVDSDFFETDDAMTKNPKQV